MPKIKLIHIAKEKEVSFEEALEVANKCLSNEMLTGKGKGTWVNEDGQDILDGAIEIPEIYPKHYYGRVVRLAPNPSYVYANIEELNKVVPCVVPRKTQSLMLHKRISIEEIKDNSGSTFRQMKIKPF
jgi:hypothetical protein